MRKVNRHNSNKYNSKTTKCVLALITLIVVTLCLIQYNKKALIENKDLFPVILATSDYEIVTADEWRAYNAPPPDSSYSDGIKDISPPTKPALTTFQKKKDPEARIPGFVSSAEARPGQDSTNLFKTTAEELFNRTIPNEELKIRRVEARWRGNRPFPHEVENTLEFFMVDMSYPDRGENIIKYILQFEEEVMLLFARLLQKDPCQMIHKEDGWRGISCENQFGTYDPIVLDIGANAGFYGLFSAKLGWEVLSIEPQPHCHQWIIASALMNGFSHRYRQINALASKEPMTTKIPQRTGCWGTWPYATHSQEIMAHELFDQSLPDLEVGSVSVDELLLYTNYIVPFMKVDTEGYERNVIESAKEMIKQKRILNIFIELGFVMWPKINETRENVKNMMLELMTVYGYQCKCYCLGTWDINDWDTPQEISDLFEPDVDIVTTECWLHLPRNRRKLI